MEKKGFLLIPVGWNNKKKRNSTFAFSKTGNKIVTVDSWIFYVANGRKINSLFGNILTKIIIFCFKYIVCVSHLQNDL
jgi:hypothetical protein